MYTHDSTDISSKISPAGRYCQVFYWVKAICVDHEVPVIFVNGWRLAAIPVVEELWQCFPFNVVDLAHIKPCAVTG